MKNRKLSIACTWGWSGGHILPLISLLQMIDNHPSYSDNVQSLYRFGESGWMEYSFFERYLPTFKHIHPIFIPIVAGKYRRETIWISRWKNLRDVFLFPVGIFQSFYRILYYHIDVIFCKWWYVSLPVVIAAWILRKKIYVHDSDTTPWLTNRLASYFATQNFSWFPDTLPDTIYVGQILSDDLLLQPLYLPFSLPNDRYIILVAGGSLWAQKLYQGVLQAIYNDKFCQDHCFFIFINGEKILSKEHLPDNSSNIMITGLITEQAMMGYLYAHADLGIVRGGTTTLAECKIFSLPLVIVPLPITHDQKKNADYYVEHYNDLILD